MASESPEHEIMNEFGAILARTIPFTVTMGLLLSGCILALEVLSFGYVPRPLPFYLIAGPFALTMTALLFGGVKR